MFQYLYPNKHKLGVFNTAFEILSILGNGLQYMGCFCNLKINRVRSVTGNVVSITPESVYENC